MRRAFGSHAAHDRLGHDVARREVGERVLVEHEPLAVGIQEDRTLAAHSLGDERLLPLRERAEPHHRRMELDELEVGDVGTGAHGQGHAVTGGHVRVRRLPEHLAEPARREDHHGCERGPDAVALARAHHVQCHALRGTPRIA